MTREASTTTSANGTFEETTIDRIVLGGIGEYQSVDVDSVVTEDYLQRLVDDHISHSKIPPNPNLLLNMLELLNNEETHISNEIVVKIFREVVRSKRVKLLEHAEDVVVKNRYDPRLLRLLIKGYVDADAPRRACKLLMEWPNESIQHQPGIESYRRVLTALGPPSNHHHDNKHPKNVSKHQRGAQSKNQIKERHDRQGRGTDNKEHSTNQRNVLEKNHRLAHRLLQHMCRTHLKFPELSLAPDRDCFHRVLGTCSSVESFPTAKEILEDMAQFPASKAGREVHGTAAPAEGNNDVRTPASFDTQPNVSTIRLLTKVWTNTFEGDKKAIEIQKQAFEFLRRIEVEASSSQQRQYDLAPSTPILSTPSIVDIDCYNILLNKLAELGQYELTEVMFLRLLTDYVKGEKSNVQPDMVTLNTVLKAHAQAHTVAAADSAERLLKRLDDFYEQQERIRKNKEFVIDDDFDDTPRVVYDVQPKARARSVIASLWVKLRQPHRAVAILAKAESVYYEKEQELLQLQQQNFETAHNYSTDTIQRFRPDKIFYRQIIGALYNLKDPPTPALATEAEAIGKRMCEMGYELNLLTCNTILNCWTKSGNPDRAEIYMEETMQQHNVVPDIVSYNTIIHGHAQLGQFDRAQELLRRILEDVLTNSHATNKLYPKPNTRTFTSILFILSKEKTIKAAEDAEGLLLRMQALSQPPYNLDTRPNFITYNAVMNCWASLSLPSAQKSRKRHAKKYNGRKAEFILRSMQGLGKDEKPTDNSYNTVIRAYSNDMDKAEELVRDMIANGLQPTEYTYNTLVHVLNRDFRIKEKDKKLEELRELYFASCSFASRNDWKNPRAGYKKNNGHGRRVPTRRNPNKKSSGRQHQQ